VNIAIFPKTIFHLDKILISTRYHYNRGLCAELLKKSARNFLFNVRSIPFDSVRVRSVSVRCPFVCVRIRWWNGYLVPTFYPFVSVRIRSSSVRIRSRTDKNGKSMPFEVLNIRSVSVRIRSDSVRYLLVLAYRC
jgi:hypothetical protein